MGGITRALLSNSWELGRIHKQRRRCKRRANGGGMRVHWRCSTGRLRSLLLRLYLLFDLVGLLIVVCVVCHTFLGCERRVAQQVVEYGEATPLPVNDKRFIQTTESPGNTDVLVSELPETKGELIPKVGHAT